MPRPPAIHPAIASPTTVALAAIAIAVLGGCGGSTKTVSIASSPTTSQTTATTTTPTTGAATAPTGATSGGGSSPAGASAAASTRTATAPAFTEKGAAGAGAEGLAAALALVRAHGYTVRETSDYRPGQTLRVLVGTGSHSDNGHDQRAFFFLDGHYLGTDAGQPSAQIGVVAQNDTEVTLAYKLYRPGDPLCCPGGGDARVRFQLNNGRLVPLDPIPPVSSTTSTSRQ